MSVTAGHCYNIYYYILLLYSKMAYSTQVSARRRRLRRGRVHAWRSSVRGSFRSNYNSSKGLVNIGRALNPLPQRYLCRMKYGDNLNIGTAGSAYIATSYRCNSIYDPAVALGGHQPYGFDQLSPLFTGYRVYKFGYKVTALPKEGLGIAAGLNLILATIMHNGGAAGYANIANVFEDPRGKYKAFAVGGNAVTIKGFTTLPKLMGVTSQTYKADNNYSSAINGNPVLPSSLDIQISTADETTPIGTDSIDLIVELYYWVEFISNILQPQS